MTNLVLHPREERQNSQKKAILGKPMDAPEEEWEPFRGQHGAARILNARGIKTKKFTHTNISAVVRGTDSRGHRRSQHNGWVFKAAD